MKTKLIFSLIATLLLFPSLVVASTIDGTWTGKLNLGMGRALTLVFHISLADTTVTMDSPDQGAFGIEAKPLLLKTDSLSIAVPSIMMTFQGRLTGSEIAGTFQQGGLKLPLTLTAGGNKVNRPQTPQPPFPYSTEEVFVKGHDVELAGTLTIPEDADRTTPVVVMVSGSGQQNRDSEIFGHKPFAVIADYLARNGIASLRYDDRGVGGSKGDLVNATTADFASDAEMMVNWLRQQNRFGKVGVIGHSEGGLIAYMLAARSDKPDFVIAIAGPSIKGSEIIRFQNKVALMKKGMTEEQANQMAAQAVNQLIEKPSNKWMEFFLNYDPASDMAKLTPNSLIIYGKKDLQVPPELNYAPAIKVAPLARVAVYDGLNHLMQHAPTGNVEEYGSIEETFAPELLAEIAKFIQSR